MSVQAIASPPAPHWTAARVITLGGLTLALGYLVILGGAFLTGQFLTDVAGRPIANDFINVWAAGQLTLDGHAADAYDWTLHKAAELRAAGYDFQSYYGWHYPPTFLFAAAALALLPLLTAAVIWLAVTLPLYAITIRAITGSRAGFWLALGFPAALWNITAGQNGFLTAALLGGTLALMEKRPALAGICLGLLSYKPHFGLLFPIALLAGGHWRVIGFAAATIAAMFTLSLIAFGSEPWRAFIEWMPVTSRVVLGDGAADWNRLQSVFGLVRAQGGGEQLAWLAQSAVAAALVVAVAVLWRGRAAFEIKAAALAAAALLATPYLYIYDLVALAVPAAFLVHAGMQRGFTASEKWLLPFAGVLLLIYPYLRTQTGLMAALIVAALILVRAITPERSARAA